MIHVDFQLNDDEYLTFKAGLKQYPARFLDLMIRGVLPDVQRFVTFIAGKIPGPVSSPFQFATEKSRHAYFATDGFGKGIPYVRTRTIASAFMVTPVLSADNLDIMLDNPEPGSVYVYGPRQVPGHKTTGWTPLAEIVEKAQDYADEQVVELWIRSSEENVP